MEHLTVGLDTAKKLKAAGFPQETALSFDPADYRLMYTWQAIDTGRIAAPTAQEVADQLAPRITIAQVSGRQWRAMHQSGEIKESGYTLHETYTTADTMAEALALTWLKLDDSTQEKEVI